MDRLETCLLCGHMDLGVRMALVRYRKGEPYGSIPRCKDVDRCRRRVEANGDEWPVADTPAQLGIE